MNFKHKINQIRSRLNMGLVKEHRMNPANEAWLKGLQDVQEKCLPAPCEGCRLPLAQKCLIFTCYYSMGYYPRRLNATGRNHYLSLEGSWMVWTLACVHGPCLGIMYSLKGCFHSPSKQKLGEGLAKLRTAREAPSDCVCPPGRCQGTRTASATPPRGHLLAAPTPLSSSLPA